ncbi:MAG: hypothetical protein NT056_06890 [Proteobacteria bacterium]|nr:hypothetical protein [Pseudomonadota bacterium]
MDLGRYPHRKILLGLFLFLLLSFPLIIYPGQQKKEVLVIFEVGLKGFTSTPIQGGVLSDALTAEFAEIGKFNLVDRDTLYYFFKQIQEKTKKPCQGPECLADLAAELDADLFVKAEVSKAQENCIFSAKLYKRNPRTLIYFVDQSKIEICPCQTDDLEKKAHILGRKLTGQETGKEEKGGEVGPGKPTGPGKGKPAFVQGGVWTTKASLHETRYYPGAAVLNGILYAIGGCPSGACGTTVTSSMEAYNPSIDTWTMKPPMPTARGWLAAAGIDGLLYAIGGTAGGRNFYNTLEVYNPATNTWMMKSPMPSPRAAPAVGVINGKLYVAGGLATTSTIPVPVVNALEVYDPETDTWIMKPPMPTARAYPGAGVIDGKLYVFGGQDIFNNTLAVLEVFSPENNSWTTHAPMPTARVAPGAGVINRKLYVIGGQANGPEIYGTLEVYDPMNNEWVTMPPMPTPRSGPGVWVVNGLLYVGGGYGQSPLSTLEVFTPYQKNLR